jgi:hypothetical protein
MRGARLLYLMEVVHCLVHEVNHPFIAYKDRALYVAGFLMIKSVYSLVA